jgi:5-methylcytosine-specific restriction endonuclease McrA
VAEQIAQAGGPDPKPERRLVDARAGLAKLRREGRCRVCGWKHHLTRHHIVPRGQRGDDADDNLVPLCERCHGELHRSDAISVRVRLRSKLTPAEIAYVISKKGLEWLDRRYPERHAR